MNKNNLLIIFAAIISVSVGIFAQQHLSVDETIDPSLQANTAQAKSSTDKLPEFSIADINGEQQSIAQWDNKIRIINFWATWCPPCLKEIPEFIKIQNAFSDKNVQFIGIAMEEAESVKQYLAVNPVNYPMLIAGDGNVSLSRQLGNIFDAVPFTLIVNQLGTIIYRQPGEISSEKIRQLINPLLQNKQ
ncbi:MAG: TlpA family protein disulfide reductase [Methylococcales symbiont of Hymedesmia sp. n. MRB-2018]|nr:MAG: TlpA family protein disulfide reductase [Methylococcales symbiont of Hymedesmia sp. n. MRB-2018]KAF3983680.1 MAG: TlpA family protein disulfide reductase [Methylococcales symbiont of Hymedesmia sp. n. MRB-2018]